MDQCLRDLYARGHHHLRRRDRPRHAAGRAEEDDQRRRHRDAGDPGGGAGGPSRRAGRAAARIGCRDRGGGAQLPLPRSPLQEGYADVPGDRPRSGGEEHDDRQGSREPERPRAAAPGAGLPRQSRSSRRRRRRPAKPKGIVKGAVKLTELSVFCRQFSTMIDAGVSLVRCLVRPPGAGDQNPRLKRITADIQHEVEVRELALEGDAEVPARLQQPLHRSGARGRGRRRPGRKPPAPLDTSWRRTSSCAAR